MEITVTSNIKNFISNLKFRYSGMRANYYIRIRNDADYANALEYGDVKQYTRKRPRAARRIGTFSLPKGGISVREKYATTVSQPPRKMVRGSLDEIRAHGRFYFMRMSKPTSLPKMRAAFDKIGDYSIKAIYNNTPELTGNLRRRWR